MVRVLGLDLGAARIGVAFGDTTVGVASPTEVIHRAKGPSIVEQVRSRVEEWEAELVVVGLPRSLDGREGPSALGVRAEAAALASALSVPVEVHDERFSTVTAQSSLHSAGMNTKQSRKVIDAVAAAVILQAWLDARAGEPS